MSIQLSEEHDGEPAEPRRRYTPISDPRQDHIDKVRRQLTQLEFELMEPQLCEECISMRVVHIIAALINGFNVGDYNDLHRLV